MTTIAHNYSDLQEINYGRYPENQAPKKNNHKRNLEQKPFVQTAKDTFEMLMRHDHGAACLWHTMISLPEIWHYRIPDLAKRINVCVNTCRFKMNILIKLGLVNREKIAGGQTEYEVYQFPEDNPLKSQSTTKSIDLTTYPRKNINIYTKQHSNNNLVSAKPMPIPVVIPENNSFKKPEKHDTVQTSCIDDTSKLDPRPGSQPEPGPPNSGNPKIKLNLTQQLNNGGLPDTLDNQQKTSDIKAVDQIPSHNPTSKCEEKRIKVVPGGRRTPGNPKIDQIMEKIEPANRNKIPNHVLKSKIDDYSYSVDQLTDICIYAIDKTSSGNRNPEHHMRRIEGYCRVLLNKHIIVPAQKHYTTFENRDTIPLSVPEKQNYDFRKKWEEHHLRLQKASEARVKKTPEIENIKEKTYTYENVFDTVDMGPLIDRLKKQKPDIDPKYKARQRLYDRIGRPDLRSV